MAAGPAGPAAAAQTEQRQLARLELLLQLVGLGLRQLARRRPARRSVRVGPLQRVGQRRRSTPSCCAASRGSRPGLPWPPPARWPRSQRRLPPSAATTTATPAAVLVRIRLPAMSLPPGSGRSGRVPFDQRRVGALEAQPQRFVRTAASVSSRATPRGRRGPGGRAPRAGGRHRCRPAACGRAAAPRRRRVAPRRAPARRAGGAGRRASGSSRRGRIDEPAVDAVTQRAPAVLLDRSVLVDGQGLARLVALGEPHHEGVADRRHRPRCPPGAVCTSGTRTSTVPCTRVQPHLVPEVGGVGEGRGAPGPPARKSASASSDAKAGGMPWRGSTSQSFGRTEASPRRPPPGRGRWRPARRATAGVSAARWPPPGTVRRRAPRRARGAAAQAARCRPAVLLGQGDVALGAGQGRRHGRDGVGARGRQARPAVERRDEVGSAARELPHRGRDIGRHRAADLDLPGGQLAREARVATHGRQRLLGHRCQVEAARLEQQQLLLEADGPRLDAREALAQGVDVQRRRLHPARRRVERQRIGPQGRHPGRRPRPPAGQNGCRRATRPASRLMV